jgi:3-isopropylmalate/(R)-2-methylmalate dehydratase large subunit
MVSSTLAERIIASHGGRDSVLPGELVVVNVDRVYIQDGNTPTIAKLFRENGFNCVFDPSKLAVFFDHSVLVPDKNMADRLREAEEFATSLGIPIFRAGKGISHIVALDAGWFQPGSIVVGADSHTCTGGVMQSMGLGMGASDVVATMVTGKTWLKVPETIWIEVKGAPMPQTRSKDVMLYALAKFGLQPFIYRSIEWTGNWLQTLSLDAAVTIANMGVEMGAKCVFLPPSPSRPHLLSEIDLPGEGDPRQLCLDIEGLPPFVAKPHLPSSAVPLDECSGQDINYVFVGSCANGRLDDLREVAKVFSRFDVHPDVQCVVTPGSLNVYLEALREGLIEAIVRAGALVTPPGCGACVGTQGPIPAAGDRVLSTMNRNFRGRMGNAEAQIWLSSPLVAAHTAILGRIPRVEELW